MRRSAVLFSVLALALAGCDPQRLAGRRPSDLQLMPDESQAPQTLRVSFDHGGHFSTRITFARFRNPDEPKRPGVLVVAGCGLAEWSRDFPPEVVQLSVDEDGDRTSEPTLAEACLAADSAAIAKAVERRLDFLVSHLARVELIDPDRVVIFASGEAAPVAAAYHARVRGKMLQGDPCLVPWRDQLDGATPTVVLWGTVASGRGWAGGATAPSMDAGEASRVATGVEGMARSCVAKPRPALPPNYQVLQGEGEISVFGRPPGLQEAGRRAFGRLTSS